MNALVKTVGWITSLFRSSGSVTVAVEWQYSSGTRRAAPGPAQLSASLWTRRDKTFWILNLYIFGCVGPHTACHVSPRPRLSQNRDISHRQANQILGAEILKPWKMQADHILYKF